MSKWIQLFVRAPEGNGYTTPKAMERIDHHLREMSNMKVYFVSPPEGLPQKYHDETFEVRVQDENLLLATERILTRHYGLNIVNSIHNNV